MLVLKLNKKKIIFHLPRQWLQNIKKLHNLYNYPFGISLMSTVCFFYLNCSN